MELEDIKNTEIVEVHEWNELFAKNVEPLFTLIDKQNGVLANHILRGIRDSNRKNKKPDIGAIYKECLRLRDPWDRVLNRDNFYLFENAVNYYLLWEKLSHERKEYIKKNRQKKPSNINLNTDNQEQLTEKEMKVIRNDNYNSLMGFLRSEGIYLPGLLFKAVLYTMNRMQIDDFNRGEAIGEASKKFNEDIDSIFDILEDMEFMSFSEVEQVEQELKQFKTVLERND